MILRRITEHVKTQNWFAVALDFVIVVVGILIAFQITEWNEARADRHREQQYLARITEDLDRNITDIEYAIGKAGERAALARHLLDCAENPELVRANPGKFIEAVVVGGYSLTPFIRSDTFDEIKSVGDLGILRDPVLRARITEFYTQIEGNDQWRYYREIRQTEYMKRASGILTLEQYSSVVTSYGNVVATEESALAAYGRMMERPEFLEWAPMLANRSDDINTLNNWLTSAKELRAQIATLEKNSETPG